MDHERSHEPHQSAQRQDAESGVDPSIIDRSELAARLGECQDLLGELIDLFLEESRRLQAEIRMALERDDTDAVARSAHTLKGSARSMAALGAAEAAGSLEQAGHGGDLPATRKAGAKLDAELARLWPALARIRQEAA